VGCSAGFSGGVSCSLLHLTSSFTAVSCACVPLLAGVCVPLLAGVCVSLLAGLCVPLLAGLCVPLLAGVCVPLLAGVCVPLLAGVCVPLLAGVCVPLLAGLCVPLLAGLCVPLLAVRAAHHHHTSLWGKQEDRKPKANTVVDIFCVPIGTLFAMLCTTLDQDPVGQIL
jgi:hypothetical protein